MSDGTIERDDGGSGLDDLRSAWNDLDALRDPDRDVARELLVVSELKRAWRDLPIPERSPRLLRPRTFSPARTLTLAIPLLAAALLLFVNRTSEPEVRRAPPESRLVADLTLVTLGTLGNFGSKGASIFFPVACLCCEVLLLSDSPWLEPGQLRSDVDQSIADAIAADCRGEWSTTAATLAPILEKSSLTHDQRTRASVAFAHASRQLGRVDDAKRAELALAK